MKKSVYSLVLMDAVVEQVDRMAYAMQTNRSNMINQILAEYCSLTTPEQRMKNTFLQLQELLGAQGFQLLVQPSASILTMRSALHYKYNPSVRYRVELFRAMEPEFGQLQVQLRTQNQDLVEEVNRFFLLWGKLEKQMLGNPNSAVGNGRFLRNLRCQPSFAGQAELAGQAVGNYVHYFDRALKRYFDYLERPERAVPMIQSELTQYCEAGFPVI